MLRGHLGCARLRLRALPLLALICGARAPRRLYGHALAIIRSSSVRVTRPSCSGESLESRSGPSTTASPPEGGEAPSSSTSVGRLCGWGLPSGFMPFEESGLCALIQVTCVLWCAPVSERGEVQRVELAIGVHDGMRYGDGAVSAALERRPPGPVASLRSAPTCLVLRRVQG